MQITTFTCEICGESATNNDVLKLVIVEVGARETRYTSCGAGVYLRDANLRQKEMCHSCRVRFGIDNPDPNLKDPTPTEPIPSLEDMIRVIIREEMDR
jgi:hypothetical protein